MQRVFSLALQLKEITAILALLFSLQAQCFDAAFVLPRHISSPMMRWGMIRGLEQRYSSQGDLRVLGDLHSISIDSKMLLSMNPEVRRLIDVLNQFGHQQLGDALHLGSLHIEAQPQIDYKAPVFAFAWTDRWMMAVGLPIFHYRNKISLSEADSNIEQIHNQVGTSIDELNKAFRRLHVSLVESAQEQLRKKGFKPLRNRDEKLNGDMLFVNVIQWLKRPSYLFATKTIVNFPTGKRDDPDDLTDLQFLAQTSVEQIGIVNYLPWSWLGFSLRAGYKWVLPDEPVVRVPIDREDSLPEPSRKEKVWRDRGDSYELAAGMRVQFLPRFQAMINYFKNVRFSDAFQGYHRDWDYSILQDESAGYSSRVKYGIEYSSAESYLSGHSYIPLLLSYEFSDTVAGRNTERQILHEVSLNLFF